MSRSYLFTEIPSLTNKDLPSHRPLHLIAGMAAINEFTTVETYVSMLLTTMAQADPVPVAAIYGVLRQGKIQARALTAVGRAVLDVEDYKLFDLLLKVTRKASDLRDVLAHRVWLYDVNIPDAVFLVDPALFWKSDHQVKMNGESGPTTTENALKIQQMMREASQVWTLFDLEQARSASVSAAVGLLSFRLMLECPKGSSERQVEKQKVLNSIHRVQTN